MHNLNSIYCFFTIVTNQSHKFNVNDKALFTNMIGGE